MIKSKLLVFGEDITDTLPLKGFPEGRARIRIRPTELVTVVVRTPDGVRMFTVTEEEGCWVPGPELARNVAKPEVIPVSEPISPITGGPVSQALYCCLCFKILKPEECNITEDGLKEDVCVPCAEEEKKAKPQSNG